MSQYELFYCVSNNAFESMNYVFLLIQQKKAASSEAQLKLMPCIITQFIRFLWCFTLYFTKYSPGYLISAKS